MIILANDGLEQKAVAELEKMGVKLDLDHYDGQALVNRLKQVDTVIIRSATKIKKDILTEVNGSKLKFIIRAGVGLDNIDVDYAKAIGIKVYNTPKASSNSVAEYVLGAIISASRFLCNADSTCKLGQWNKKAYEGTEIAGKTLGIIGFGNIGKTLAKKARSLDIDVLYYDQYVDDKNYEKVDLDKLLKKSDFISLHIPLIKENFLGKEEFEKMKKGVILINTSRGENIDEEALVKYVDAGIVAGAFLDVFKKEPLENKNLMRREKIYLTPHIAGSTKEAQQNIGKEIVQIIKGKLE